MKHPTGMETPQTHGVRHEVDLFHGYDRIDGESRECDDELPPLPCERVVLPGLSGVHVIDELLQPRMFVRVGPKNGGEEFHELPEAFIDDGILHCLRVLGGGSIAGGCDEFLQLPLGAFPVEPPDAPPGTIELGEVFRRCNLPRYGLLGRRIAPE